MFNLIDNFYQPSDFGLVVSNFLNLHFFPSYQPQTHFFGGDRMKAYPCFESPAFKYDKDNPLNYCTIFQNTFEKKTGLKVLHAKTYLRKTKLSELKESPSWNQYKPHQDNNNFDMAGVVYYNSNSIKDGTNFYMQKDDYEPTAVIGAKMNRCVFYNSQVFHSPVMEQKVEERWVQPFFIITNEETLKKFKESDGA
tara:strand:+ start:184 stop:768 length:585 start_codon:yes stop_codon:yes gene_type:complete